MPETWYDDPEVGKRACSTIPLYDGRNVEVGSRARAASLELHGEGVVAQHVARAMEMKQYISKIVDILANRYLCSCNGRLRYNWY